MELLHTILKQPYWIISLLVGAILVAMPCATIDKDFHWMTHAPTSYLLVGVGLAMLSVSIVAFLYSLSCQQSGYLPSINGASQVKELNGGFSANISGCDVSVQFGKIEDFAQKPERAVVLPCNEYFDDKCVFDATSALGAFAAYAFSTRTDEFARLIKIESERKFGPPAAQPKTAEEHGGSFGVGRCLLLPRPLGATVPVALISTTTQRPGDGHVSRMAYLFAGVRELFACLADARLQEAVLPILGSGRGQIAPPLALLGMLLAIAESARHSQGGQRLKSATIIVFRKDAKSRAEVQPIIARCALAIVKYAAQGEPE